MRRRRAIRKPVTATAVISASARANAAILRQEKRLAAATSSDGPESDVDGAAPAPVEHAELLRVGVGLAELDGAATAPVEHAAVPSVAVGPAEMDCAAVVRPGLGPAVPGGPPGAVSRGAPPPVDEPGAPAPGADPRGGAAGGWAVGLGAGLVVGFGAGGGGAGAAGGAIRGWRPAPNAQPSTVPGAGS